MANINEYTPASGLVVGADGKVYDVTKLLQGQDGDTGLTDDIGRYAYHGGLVVDSDGNVRDITALISASHSQFTTMPVAGATWEGRVIQYVGAPGGAYVQGHFYVCRLVGRTYIWVEITSESEASVVGTTLVFD